VLNFILFLKYFIIIVPAGSVSEKQRSVFDFTHFPEVFDITQTSMTSLKNLCVIPTSAIYNNRLL